MICALLVFPTNFAASARASGDGETTKDQIWSQPNTKRKRLLQFTKISGDRRNLRLSQAARNRRHDGR
jgi:hypothetical protein